MQETISFSLLLFAIIISNIIMIFNINSTRGQTRFLTCIARAMANNGKVRLPKKIHSTGSPIYMTE